VLLVSAKPTNAIDCVIRAKNCQGFKYYSVDKNGFESQIDFETFKKHAYMSEHEARTGTLESDSRPDKLVIEGNLDVLSNACVELIDTRGYGEFNYNDVAVTEQADACILVVDAFKIQSENTQKLFEQILLATGQVFVVVNKCDVSRDVTN
jgi:translation elongation factor EF-G